MLITEELLFSQLILSVAGALKILRYDITGSERRLIPKTLILLISTEDMVADRLTKAVDPRPFRMLQAMIEMP